MKQVIPTGKRYSISPPFKEKKKRCEQHTHFVVILIVTDSRFNFVASVHDFHLLALHAQKCEAIPVGGDKAPGMSDSTKQETPFTLQLDTLGRDKVASTGRSTAQRSLNPRRNYYTGFEVFY